MKKSFKKLLAVVLSAVILTGTASVSFAVENTAKLGNVYGDGMLFQQKKEAIISGTASSGAEMSAELTDDRGEPVTKCKATANKKGGFTLSFIAPEGGYKAYKINFYENGVLFRTLNDVVFGELWLASGQSNMSYTLASSDTYEQNKNGSEWLRFLYINALPTYQGDENKYPVEPMSDFEDGNCRWIKGNSSNVGSVSAVSFFFAQKLEKELGMPVGVLTPNLGGSLLASWLSREAINSDPVFAAYLKEKGNYLDSEFKNEDVSAYATMTANYNKKLAPLRNFRISGMIWYQGESETMSDWKDGMYKRGLELLQSSYGDLFSYDGKLPFIATQLVPFDYNKNSLALHNNEFLEFCSADRKSRSMTTIYDVSMGYIPEIQSIHPAAKQPVGERMAHCAAGLVYGKNSVYTAAYLDSYRIDGNSVYVKFASVGDGLRAKGGRLYGFSLCDESGIYVQADAEIVSEDTVRIYSAEVEKPVAAAYAFAENCSRSNLFSTYESELLMPVAGFTTDKANAKLYFEDPVWASCDFSEGWYTSMDVIAGFHNTWNGGNARISFDGDCFDGTSCMTVAGEKNFYAAPTIGYKDGDKIIYFNRLLTDWSGYSSVSVMLRNNGEADVELSGLKLYINDTAWFVPEVNMLGEASTVIPADGKWYRVDFDLNSLYFFGNECGGAYSRAHLDDIKDIRLCFKDKSGKGANVSVDEFRFTPDGTDCPKIRFEASVKNADNPFEFICAVFVSIIGVIASIFIKK